MKDIIVFTFNSPHFSLSELAKFFFTRMLRENGNCP